MRNIRKAIIEDRFPSFVKQAFHDLFGGFDKYPKWAINALNSINIDLTQ